VAGKVAQPVAVGREDEVIGAGAAQRGGDLLALGGGSLLEAPAHLAAAGVHDDLATRLRIDHPQIASGRQLELARVAHLDRQHAVPGAQRAQAALPVARAAEVGDDDDESACAGNGGHTTGRLAHRRGAGAVGGRLGAQLGEQAEQPEAALARAQHARLGPAERDDAEPVAAPRGDVADGDAHALGDVRLAPQRRAEAHRRRDVEHQPRRHSSLADVHAHVRLAQPRRHVPVDVAHVVARLVRPDHRQLGTGADLRRDVFAGHERLDPAHHGQVERAQDGVGYRARPGPIRRALGLQPRRAPHGSLPFRSKPVTSPASSSARPPPANAAVISCFALRFASPRPRFA
jgi:hypothetical protein